MKPGRVVSLLPSATEIVDAIGCLDRLVGRSHECDFPLGVEALPVCTRPRIALDGTSAEIDAKVKDAVRDAIAVYEVLVDVLADLRPDVIITQDQCEVCAVSLADVETAVSSWSGRETAVVSLRPQSIEDVEDDIVAVADALGSPKKGRAAAAAMRERVDAVAARAQGVDHQPAVACVEWTEPLMAAGNWVPEMVALAGGRDVLGPAGGHAPWIEFEDLIAADPDVIVFMPCDFGLERTAAEARALLARPEWAALSAARAGRVYATDANAYFNRPGPRLAQSVEILAEILHPDVFDIGRRGKAWMGVEAS